MVQPIPPVDHVPPTWQAALTQAAARCRVIKVAKHAHVYTAGDQDTAIYFVESGQIKLLRLTPDGKE